jgi:hypothetical protein
MAIQEPSCDYYVNLLNKSSCKDELKICMIDLLNLIVPILCIVCIIFGIIYSLYYVYG